VEGEVETLAQSTGNGKEMRCCFCICGRSCCSLEEAMHCCMSKKARDMDAGIIQTKVDVWEICSVFQEAAVAGMQGRGLP